MNGTPVSTRHDIDEAERQAVMDKATAIKVLGGFGQRVHLGSVPYAQQIDKALNALVNLNAEDVECAMMLIKVREVGATPAEDKFKFIGGNYGTEPELTALHALLGAEVRLFRISIAKRILEANQPQEATDAVQDEAGNSEGVQDN